VAVWHPLNHCADPDPVGICGEGSQRNPRFHAWTLRIANKRVEMVEIPATGEHVHLISGAPYIEHFLPTAVLGWCLDPKIHW
jgi:hypothetical protein